VCLLHKQQQAGDMWQPQANNLALFQPMFFETSQPRPGLAKFLRVHAKNVDNFQRNSFM
jgi:hypothetical protein